MDLFSKTMIYDVVELMGIDLTVKKIAQSFIYYFFCVTYINVSATLKKNYNFLPL